MALVGMVALATLTGCGGGGVPRGPLTVRVAAVCKQAKRETNAINNPRFRSPARVAAYLARVLSIAAWRLQQFQRLRPSGDISSFYPDSSDWGSFMGRVTAATNMMGLVAKRASKEAATKQAGRASYDLFYSADDQIGVAADNITSAAQGIPDCYS